MNPAVVNPAHLRHKKLACVALENMSTHGLHCFVTRRNRMKSHARVVVVGGGVMGVGLLYHLALEG